MPRTAQIPNIDAYLKDIAFVASEALKTSNPVAKALCIRTLCGQSDALTDLVLEVYPKPEGADLAYKLAMGQ
jgi:hypothetical protein